MTPASASMMGALPDDHKVHLWHELCLALGGSPDSFTGLLLSLIEKADPGNLARLRAGFPRQVAAWEIWMTDAATLTAGELKAALAATPDR
jgi:hypothetical protein